MTESEAIEKLRAYHKCQILQVKGIYEDCNEELCNNCDLCYAQGNVGEHIKSIEVALNALEKQIPKKPYCISQLDDNDNAYVECPVCRAISDYSVNVIKRGHCWKCGQLLDWSDEE